MGKTIYIKLTSKGVNAGPVYNVQYSEDCTTYFDVTGSNTVTLNEVNDVDNILVPVATQCLRLINQNISCNENSYDIILDGVTTTTVAPTTTTTTLEPTTTTTTLEATTTTTTLEPTTTTTTLEPTTTTTTTLAPDCEFVVTSKYTVDYLVVAGGGGAGLADGFGGGGAGGFISGSGLLAAQSYTITVGLRGGVGVNGNNSILSGGGLNIEATGGGHGGWWGAFPGCGNNPAGSGGSGGGGGSPSCTSCTPGGSTSSGTGIPGQGFNGLGPTGSGGGKCDAVGGGAGGTGDPAGSTNRRPGPGKYWFDGNIYATGGGGAQAVTPVTPGVILDGIQYPQVTGFGRGGGGHHSNKPGFDGRVKIRYSGTPRATGGIITQSGGYTYHEFNENGTFEFV